MKKIKKILISQPAPASDKSPYSDMAKRYDVEMVFRPFIKIEGLTGKELRQSKINLAEYNGVLFNSRTAVDNYFRLLEETRVPKATTTKYFCTAESIALYLQKYIVYRKRKIFFGETGKITDPVLMASLTKHSHAKEKLNLLMPVSDVHTETEESRALDAAGIKYTKAIMYRTVSNDFNADEKLDYDLVVFFSPAGVAALLNNFPDFKETLVDKVHIGAYGALAAKAVEDAGLPLALKAPTPQTPSMTGALEAFLRQQQQSDAPDNAGK